MGHLTKPIYHHQDNIFLSKYLFKLYKNKKIRDILLSMKSFEIHPLYNRDFMQGLFDASCYVYYENNRVNPKVEFYSKPKIREFLELNSVITLQYSL